MAHLTHSADLAAHMAINHNTTTVLSWHNTEGCSFRGLTLHAPEHHHPHGSHGRTEKHGDCVFSDVAGSAGMVWDADLLRWKQPHFDFWLACENPKGEVELKYWGAQVHGTWRESGNRCAEVKLRAVAA